MTSRRVRGPAAHRAAGGEPPLASRGMQNSQRVLLTKPRNGNGAHDAKPRTAPMARRRDGDIAPYRQAARVVRAGEGARQRDRAWCAPRRGAVGDARGREGGKRGS